MAIFNRDMEVVVKNKTETESSLTCFIVQLWQFRPFSGHKAILCTVQYTLTNGAQNFFYAKQ